MRIRITGEDVSGTADTQNYTETAAESQDNGGWGQPVGGNHTTKRWKTAVLPDRRPGGYQEW